MRCSEINSKELWIVQKHNLKFQWFCFKLSTYRARPRFVFWHLELLLRLRIWRFWFIFTGYQPKHSSHVHSYKSAATLNSSDMVSQMESHLRTYLLRITSLTLIISLGLINLKQNPSVDPRRCEVTGAINTNSLWYPSLLQPEHNWMSSSFFSSLKKKKPKQRNSKKNNKLA